MISTICYALVYLLTMVIAFYYYNSKFSLKTQKKLVPLWIFALTAVLLCINFLSNPIINSVSFLGSMFFISSFCYNAKFTQL